MREFHNNELTPDGELEVERQKNLENIVPSDLTKEEYAIAMGEENRYYASQSLGREATDEEALDYFIRRSPDLHARLGLAPATGGTSKEEDRKNSQQKLS